MAVLLGCPLTTLAMLAQLAAIPLLIPLPPQEERHLQLMRAKRQQLLMAVMAEGHTPLLKVAFPPAKAGETVLRPLTPHNEVRNSVARAEELGLQVQWRQLPPSVLPVADKEVAGAAAQVQLLPTTEAALAA